MPKKREGEVLDASKANQAAHGYIGELFTEENEKITIGEGAFITMDTALSHFSVIFKTLI